MNKEEWAGILLLIIVSLSVRTIPSLAKLPRFITEHPTFERFAPIAVLVNLGVFCVLSEIQSNPLPAILGFAVLGLIFLLSRQCSILLTLILATLAFSIAAMLN